MLCENWYITIKGEEKGNDIVEGPMSFAEAGLFAGQIQATFPGTTVVLSKELTGQKEVQSLPADCGCHTNATDTPATEAGKTMEGTDDRTNECRNLYQPGELT